jgi:hypothetical protein
MVQLLLLCAMLFQAAPQAAKPVIDNDRVTVWDVNAPTTAQPLDAVVVSFSGNAVFLPKGATPKIDGRTMIVDLKDHPVPPIPNNSGYPLAFPRPGAKKILENERVIVWDVTWTQDVATPMHFHDKDALVVYLEDGQMRSTTPDGKATVTPQTAGMVKFNARDRIHTETLISGKQHAIITELK